MCVLSGGLGPTHDDRTVETLARVAGRELHVDAGLAREIEGVSRAVAQRLGRPYADFAAGVRKQASLPDGAVALGLAGTAPAVLLERDGGLAVALPGPPGELRRLWPKVLESAALRRLLERVDAPRHRILRFFGPSESAVAGALEQGGEGGLEVTVCAHDLEIRVDLLVRAGAEERAERVEKALREHFAADLFAEDERPIEEIVLERCRALGLPPRHRRVLHRRARRRPPDGRRRRQRRLRGRRHRLLQPAQDAAAGRSRGRAGAPRCRLGGGGGSDGAGRPG